MKTIPPSKNAVQSGAYSRDALLPWESQEDYKQHLARIFAELQPDSDSEILTDIANNYAENRWIRKRTRRMSAIATWRHPFGELLANSGARTWQEILRAVRKYRTDDRKLVQNIAESMESISEALNELADEFEPEKLQKNLEDLSENYKRLGRIEDATDHVEQFFLEYSPERLQKRVLLENALDAQADKLLARFSIEQERRALRKSQKTEGSPAAQSQSVNETAASMKKIVDCLSDGASGELDLAELDREDSDAPGTMDPDADVWEETKRDEGD